MRSILRLSWTIVLASIGLAGGQSAIAAYITETNTVTLSQTTTDFSKLLALPTFDTSMGTLNSVVISYTDSGTMQGFIQNTSAKSQSFTITEKSVDTLSYGTTTLLTNNLIAIQSYTSLGATQSSQFGVDTPSGSAAPVTITTGPLFNAFLEPSSQVMLNFGTLTSTNVSGGGGNISTGIYTTVGATITVDFVYTPFVSVPEPSSLLMTAIGGFILAGASYRSRRNSRRSADRN